MQAQLPAQHPQSPPPAQVKPAPDPQRPAAKKDLHRQVAAAIPPGMAIETSLILLKPDAVEKRLVGPVLARFQAAGFQIRGIKMMRLSEEILREHYAHIAHLPFFPGIITFMSKTPVVAVALEGENAITAVRDLLGPTDSKAAAPGTIRGDLGEDKMVNVCHASDSTDSAAAELERFFRTDELFAF